MTILFRDCSPGPAFDAKRSSLGKLHKSRYYLLAVVLLVLYLVARTPRHAGEQHILSKDYSILNMPDQAKEHVRTGMPLPWAVSYSPYTSVGLCKPLATIMGDLEAIEDAGIRAVRLYSLDCRVLQAVESTDLDIVLGLQPRSDSAGVENSSHLNSLIKCLDSQLADISHWGHWERISMLAVGSQGVFEETYTRAELVKILRYVRLVVSQQPKFNGLLTTAEPVESWISPTRYNAASLKEYKLYQQYESQLKLEDYDYFSNIEDNDLCEAVDVIGLVVEPFFNSAAEAEDAGNWLVRDVKYAHQLCSDAFIGSAHTSFDPSDEQGANIPVDSTSKRPVIVLEAGWPNQGKDNGHALASENEQRIAIEEMITARLPFTGSRIPISLYSYDNELWREPGDFEVETAFGVRALYS